MLQIAFGKFFFPLNFAFLDFVDVFGLIDFCVWGGLGLEDWSVGC